ncbi:MAG: hypothetical protein Q8O00_06350 [Holophaga sp.]|nr:hypothetical protein [Holophaga sp.]
MTPLGQTGFVKEGPLQGWFVRVSQMELPKGFLVSRARNAAMDQTLILDGIFPEREKLEAFFQDKAPIVEWAD